jgi:hypothetical protein
MTRALICRFLVAMSFRDPQVGRSAGLEATQGAALGCAREIRFRRIQRTRGYEGDRRMIRAGLVVIVVVSVALLMMVMTADWLDAWPFLIGRARHWWYMSGFLAGLLTGWVASLVTVALYRRGLFGPTFPVSGPEDLATRLVGRTLSDVQGENGLILTFGDRQVIITSADPYQPLEVAVRSSQIADDPEEDL